MTTPDLPTPREVAQQAAEILAERAERFMRAAQSLTHMVMRLSTVDDPVKVVISIAKYQQSALPEPEALTEIVGMLEATKSPEWRKKKSKQRLAGWRERLGRRSHRTSVTMASGRRRSRLKIGAVMSCCHALAGSATPSPQRLQPASKGRTATISLKPLQGILRESAAFISWRPALSKPV
jgi:hypothetical protein